MHNAPDFDKLILLKILPRQYLGDFLDGNLYLNTCKRFGALDRSDVARFDPDDGIDESLVRVKLDVQSEQGGWLPLPVIGPTKLRSEMTDTLNVLCLYAVTNRENDSFDQRNLGFGCTTVIINDLMEFIRRVRLTAESLGKDVAHGPVQYINPQTYCGVMGPFKKYLEFSYQNEFRFVFTNGSGIACRLSIGDLRDITHVIDTKNVPEFWRTMLKKI